MPRRIFSRLKNTKNCRKPLPTNDPTPEEIRFEKDVDLMLDIARAEYKARTIDDAVRQDALARTYLWLSTAILAAIGAGTGSIIETGKLLGFFIDDSSCTFHTLWFFSFLCAFFVLLMGIHSLHGKGMDVVGNFRDRFEKAQMACAKHNFYHTRLSILNLMDETITDRIKETTRRGKILQKMSSLLLLASGSGIMAVIFGIMTAFHPA